MQNLSKIDTAKDLVTKEWVEAKDFLPSEAFTKNGIKNALGIADWALAASKPSYDDVYLKLAGGTINGNLTVSGQFKSQTSLASVSLLSNIFDVNASLKIQPGWNLYLNGEAIMKWSDLKSKIAYSFSEISSKPTTLSGYGITDAVIYQSSIDTSSAYKNIGYGHATTGWKASGPAMIFGTSAYNLAIQSLLVDSDTIHLYARLKYNGVENGWDRLLTQNSLAESNYSLGIRTDSPAYPLDVNGEINSSNYMAGKVLSTNPTSAFISTIFDADAVSDKSYRLRLLRNSSAMDRFAPAFAPVLAFKTNDTHAFISIAYNTVGMRKCCIGGGTGDTIAWTGILFHDDMSLIPRWGDNHSLGDATHRWKEVHAGSITLGGRTISNWDQVRMTAYAIPATTGSQSLLPNNHYTFSNTLTSSSNISIALTDDTSGESITKIYYIVFRTGSTTPTFTFNRTLYWKDGKGLTTLAANKRYRIVIDNNLATLETYS